MKSKPSPISQRENYTLPRLTLFKYTIEQGFESSSLEEDDITAPISGWKKSNNPKTNEL